jgi:hypothetical protein
MKVLGAVTKEQVKKQVGMRYDEIVPLTPDEVFRSVARKHNVMPFFNKKIGLFQNHARYNGYSDPEMIEDDESFGHATREAAYKAFCKDFIDVEFVEQNPSIALLQRGDKVYFNNEENQTQEAVVWSGVDNMGLDAIDGYEVELTVMTRMDNEFVLVKLPVSELAHPTPIVSAP